MQKISAAVIIKIKIIIIIIIRENRTNSTKYNTMGFYSWKYNKGSFGSCLLGHVRDVEVMSK